MGDIGERMLDGDVQPDAQRVAAWLGVSEYKHWTRLLEFIKANYPGVFTPDWIFGGKKYGWGLRFKKSKSFCTLIPERNRLVVQIVFGGEGPLARRKLAYLERTLVRPEYRRRGLGTRLLGEAMRAGREAGCLYLRCSNDWDNEAERRLFLKCGFALVDLNGESDQEPCYFAVRPLQGREEL